MSEHEEGCEWPNVCLLAYHSNRYGDDEKLTIDCTGIELDPSVHSCQQPIERIDFKFCPLCGCSLT